MSSFPDSPLTTEIVLSTDADKKMSDKSPNDGASSDVGGRDDLGRSIDVAFRNLKDAKIFAMDIGGSLAKIAYYSTVPSK